jgi:NADH:ubiquinone oxidoreductase subunit 6 (chain J)
LFVTVGLDNGVDMDNKMVWVFYVAAIIVILTSMKIITSRNAVGALLYFVISLLATSVIFIAMDAYLSVFLVLIVFICIVSLIFLLVISILKLRKDVVEQGKYGINPKIWLGPLILAFILFVTLIYGIASTDYETLSNNHTDDIATTMGLLMEDYILIIELAALLLIGALVIAYHFVYRIYMIKCTKSQDNSKSDLKDKHDSVNA